MAKAKAMPRIRKILISEFFSSNFTHYNK